MAVYPDSYETETRTYNVNGQMTQVGWAPVTTSPGGLSWAGGSISYNYSSTQNNGQITQAVDSLSGETIVRCPPRASPLAPTRLVA